MPRFPGEVIAPEQRRFAQFASLRIKAGRGGMPYGALKTESLDVDFRSSLRDRTVAVSYIEAIKRCAIDVCGTFTLILPVQVEGVAGINPGNLEAEPSLIKKFAPVERQTDRLEVKLARRFEVHRIGPSPGKCAGYFCYLRPNGGLYLRKGSGGARQCELQEWIFREHG